MKTADVFWFVFFSVLGTGFSVAVWRAMHADAMPGVEAFFICAILAIGAVVCFLQVYRATRGR